MTEQIVEAPRAHARLSASGSDRWIHCTPSVQLEEQFPDEHSEFAAEGTFAHGVAEFRLRHWLGLTTDNDLAAEEEEARKSKYWSEKLNDAINEYVERAQEQIETVRAATPDAIVEVEMRCDFSRWVPDGFGTGDLVIVADGTLYVRDAKFGQGVKVYAQDNSQMRLYGLGAYDTFAHLYDIKRVHMTIDQPRLDHVDEEEISVMELLDWAASIVPAAQLAWDGAGDYVPGDHCGFCRARFTCRARAEANLALARLEFQDAPLLSDEELGEVIAKAADLAKWAGDVEKYALKIALEGRTVPGWKVVHGRSNRVLSGHDTAAKRLTEAGYDEALLYERSLLSMTNLEKLVGKKKFAEMMADLISKPPGKPVLAPASDKRDPYVSSAAEDFADEVDAGQSPNEAEEQQNS